MATTLHAGMHPAVQVLLQTIAQVTGKDIDLERSKSFKAVIESPDGQALNLRVIPLDPGGGGTVTRVTGKAGRDLTTPSSGAADFDGTSGTAIMSASTIDVTVAGGVPADAIVYAIVTTPGGKVKSLSAVRKDADEITISSAGDGFGALLGSAGVDGTLVAGAKADIALANAAGDLLAVTEKTAGGSAADHFSIVRVSDALVKVQAHDAAGALVAGNTSVVTAYNIGAKGHETSTVRWIVIRP